MRIWKLKDEHREGKGNLLPHDLICCEMGNLLLFIQEEGTYDVCDADMGLPTDGMWDLIAE